MANHRLTFSVPSLIGLLLVTLTVGLLVLLPGLEKAKESQLIKPVSQLPVYRSVLPFALTNHAAKAVTLADFAGKVWVAQIIFTKCPGPCPRMAQFFSKLQSKLPADGSVQLVTLTTDPDFDTPPVLARYATRFAANPNLWSFLTGSKAEIRKLAVDGLGLTALDKDPSSREGEDDLFIHSTISVVVDQSGRVRATVESLEPGATQQVLDLVAFLKSKPALQ